MIASIRATDSFTVSTSTWLLEGAGWFCRVPVSLQWHRSFCSVRVPSTSTRISECAYLPRWSSKDRSSGSCWLPRMEQLFDGLFRVLDPRAVLAIVLLCFELLQETETRRSGRVPRSAVLGHAETLLAAMRHLITNESCTAHFLHPGAATGAKLHAVRRKHNQRER